MLIALSIILLLLMPSSLYASQQTIVGCFSNGTTNLKFTEIISKEASLGYILYEKGSAFIPLAFVGRTEEVFEGRPSEFTYTWREVIKGQVNGTYVVSTQGAVFNDFYYKSDAGKIIRFKENIAVLTDDMNCKW